MDRLRDQLRTNKFAKIIEIISIFLVAFIIIKIFAQPDSDNLIYNQAIIWIVYIIMFTMVWMGIRIRGENWQDFGLSFKKISLKGALRVFLLSLLVFVLGVAGFVIGSIIMANITGIPESADMSSYAFLKDNIWALFLSLASVYIISSFGEEVIFRAFLITRISELGLDNKRGRIVAVFISAVVFGFAHYSWGPMGVGQTAFMGLAMGFCYIYMKRRLWALIFAHAYMDTILLVQIYLASN